MMLRVKIGRERERKRKREFPGQKLIDRDAKWRIFWRITHRWAKKWRVPIRNGWNIFIDFTVVQQTGLFLHWSNCLLEKKTREKKPLSYASCKPAQAEQHKPAQAKQHKPFSIICKLMFSLSQRNSKRWRRIMVFFRSFITVTSIVAASSASFLQWQLLSFLP